MGNVVVLQAMKTTMEELELQNTIMNRALNSTSTNDS